MRGRNKIGDHDSFYGEMRAEETGRKGKNEQLPGNYLGVRTVHGLVFIAQFFELSRKAESAVMIEARLGGDLSMTGTRVSRISEFGQQERFFGVRPEFRPG
jgi:hypothetical protein